MAVIARTVAVGLTPVRIDSDVTGQECSLFVSGSAVYMGGSSQMNISDPNTCSLLPSGASVTIENMDETEAIYLAVGSGSTNVGVIERHLDHHINEG